MKSIRNISLIIAGSLILVILNSCCESYAYRWTYIITSNLKNEEVSFSDSIAAEDFGIRIHLFDQKYSSLQINPVGNKLYAFTCEEIYYKEDTITKFEIISIGNLNENHGPGALVNDLFMPGERYLDGTSIDQMISEINRDTYKPINQIDLLLTDTLVNNSTQQFLINIHLSDGRILSDSTNKLKIY